MNYSLKAFLFFFIVINYSPVMAQSSQQANDSKVFHISNPDYTLSPHTGMTRKHWKDAALYLLEGAFSYIKKLDDPMKFPKQPGKSYPRSEGQVPTEKLEGLCRTLFVAAPPAQRKSFTRDQPYKSSRLLPAPVAKLVDSTSDTFIKPRAKNGGPSQNLVEFGGLSVSLFAIPELLWEPLTLVQKDALAATMISYGDGPTVPSNWKFFNIFVLSFYKSKGYTVNEKLLEEYLQKTLDHYRGEGWYNDNPAYDYYSMWAFQMYGMLWSEFFGKKQYPDHAAKFLANFKEIKDNYPYMFSRDGQMIMWGRSIGYRCGSIIPFPLTGLENDPNTNYGWMRRISSGVLLQFLQNPDFLKDNVPQLGFYGAFEPAVQSYSCRGSMYWLGKAFLGLLVPENNPFWTATENEGAWQKELAKGKVYNKFQKGSNILITDYPNIGASEIRAWCNVKVIGAGEPFRGSENYNRLSYNSAFPWQADSVEGTVAMNYIFKNRYDKWEAARLFTFKKFEDGIYYRDVVLETNSNIQLSLADIPVPNGILRVDRNTSTEPVELRLGHYALPQLKGAIKKQTRKVKGIEVKIINNGVYQLAMVPVLGWDKIETVQTKGVHPASDESAVIITSDKFTHAQSDQMVHYVTLMLWKKANEKWTNDELYPFKKIKFDAESNRVVIEFINGEKKTVKYE